MSRLAWLLALAGLLLLVAAPTAWHLSQVPDTVGDLQAVAAPAPEPTPEPPPPPELGPWGDGLTPEPPTRAVEPEPVTAPVSLRLPSLGVVAPLDAVSLEPDGAMEIPHDIRRVGWYEPGVMPGEPSGTTVLSGHVDSREQGRGALWGLKDMDVGDEVTIEHEDGRTTTWRVEARTSYLKEQLPIADIFTRFGDPRLVLITCGGDFDRSARRYTRNIVVYAVPVTDAEAEAA
ncbi:MAG: class F sortase [Nitriliruptor sp.]|nr:MAG: class F sortase [Nitriliruptor sp.]